MQGMYVMGDLLTNDAPTSSLMDSIVSPKVKTTKGGVGGTPWLTTLGVQRGMLELWNGIRLIDKQINCSHMHAQTKQHVGQCVVGAFWCIDEPRVNTDSQDSPWPELVGEPPPSPLQYTLCMATRPAPKCHFVPGFPSGSPEILKIGTFANLEAHNFA